MIGAVERHGCNVAKVIDWTDVRSMTKFARAASSDKVSLLASDEHKGYKLASHTHKAHKTVNDAKGEYVVGAVHTNTIDGFWSILKLGIAVMFHNVSATYLALHVAEFEFCYNIRLNPNMLPTALEAC